MIALELSNWATLLIAIFAAAILWSLFCAGGWKR